MVLHLALALQWKPLLQLMVNLKHRSKQTEILDTDNLPFAAIALCMHELNIINSLLGGHAITIKGVKEFIPTNNIPITICEIGCGGGDNLHAIDKKLKNHKYIGIDLKPTCTNFAATIYPQLKAKWIASDYSKVDFGNEKPDIIFSSLFCHHFSNAALVHMLQYMYTNSKKGFFINDLQRNAIAYYLIKWLTAAFSKSYMVKNDAPISVARSFTKADWISLFKLAGITNYSIKWQWAFRYLIVCKK